MQMINKHREEAPWKGSFITDVKALRERARKHMEQGAVTEGYLANREVIVNLLNEALATEIVCVLRYKRHFFMAQGINASNAATEFLQHATDEQGHADRIAARIVQLQGEPNFDPDGLSTRSHAEYVEGSDLVSMIREDLIAERIAIATPSRCPGYLVARRMTMLRSSRTLPGKA